MSSMSLGGVWAIGRGLGKLSLPLGNNGGDTVSTSALSLEVDGRSAPNLINIVDIDGFHATECRTR